MRWYRKIRYALTGGYPWDYLTFVGDYVRECTVAPTLMFRIWQRANNQWKLN